MGCGASSVADIPPVTDVSAKNQAFVGFLAQENAIALGMEGHWNEFMQENDCKKRGDRLSATSHAETRLKDVEVNRYQSQAEAQQITMPIAKRVAESFLGYAMTVLDEKEWDGKLAQELIGESGTVCKVRVWGEVSFKGDHVSTVHTTPYEVTFSFFVL